MTPVLSFLLGHWRMYNLQKLESWKAAGLAGSSRVSIQVTHSSHGWSTVCGGGAAASLTVALAPGRWRVLPPSENSCDVSPACPKRDCSADPSPPQGSLTTGRVWQPSTSPVSKAHSHSAHLKPVLKECFNKASFSILSRVWRLGNCLCPATTWLVCFSGNSLSLLERRL